MSLSRKPLLSVLALLAASLPLAGQQPARQTVRPISAGNTGMTLAEALLRDGRRKDAADALGRWLSEHPTDGRAWHYLGRIHLDEARRWHRSGHEGDTDGGMLLDFAATAFEQSQRLLADSGTVYRVLVAVERATVTAEQDGWAALAALSLTPEELPLPPVLGELGENLLASCPANGVLVTGSMVETAAVWGRWLLHREARPDLLLLRPELYSWDARYRVRMAEELGVPIEASLPEALLQVTTRRPLCLTPTVDSLTAPAIDWRPVRLVLAAGVQHAPEDTSGALSVHQFALTGLAGSVWSEAARDVYDLAARRNRDLCRTLLQGGDLTPNLPAIASCAPRE
jgi:hypothetical protein